MTESVSVMRRRSAVDPDQLLLDAIAAGDEQAMHRLYQTHALALLNYLIYELNDRPSAEEVLQDVMLAVWKQAPQFQGNSTVKTWLYAIAHRKMLKVRKRCSRLHQSVDDLEIASEQPSLSHAIEHHDKAASIQLALEQLPPDQQEALELIFYRGMSGPRAAEHVGVSINTFKSRLFRARRTLRGLLNKEDIHHV